MLVTNRLRTSRNICVPKQLKSAPINQTIRVGPLIICGCSNHLNRRHDLYTVRKMLFYRYLLLKIFDTGKFYLDGVIPPSPYLDELKKYCEILIRSLTKAKTKYLHVMIHCGFPKSVVCHTVEGSPIILVKNRLCHLDR